MGSLENVNVCVMEIELIKAVLYVPPHRSKIKNKLIMDQVIQMNK